MPEPLVKDRRAEWKLRNPVKVSICNAVYAAQARANKRGIPFDLPPGFAAKLAEESNGKCAISGLSFRPPTTRGQNSMWSPSLDRKRPELGYVEGNVRLILNGLNALKSTGTDEELIEICKAVARKNQ